MTKSKKAINQVVLPDAPIGGHAEALAKAFGYLTVPEVRFLQWLTLQLPANCTVINIGAGAGTTALAVAEARPDVTIHTIEISAGGPWGSTKGERNAFEKVGMLNRLPIQHLGDSRATAAAWEGPKADLIIVDDGHGENEVRGDLLGWLPWLIPGGWIVFHDYTSPDWPAVKMVADELLGGSPRLVGTFAAWKME